jgi:hypothetical protein
MVDACCRQPLRATIDTLPLYGPGVRVSVPRGRGTQPVTLITTRWPVLEVVSVQYAQNCLPYNWSTIPSGVAVPSYPPTGLYGSSAPPATGEGGQSVRIPAGYVDWRYGPDGFAVLLEYVNGWPHCGLTAAAAEGATTLTVDDCTGWVVSPVFPGAATGATGTVYDAGGQEVIQVTAASAVQGPGTLTLASPLLNAHAAGVMVSSLPQSAVWGAALFGAAQALTRGATSTTVREIPGKGTEGSGIRAASLEKQARDILAPFDPNTETQIPTAYIWPTAVNEKRLDMPRNTGPGTPAASKTATHSIDVFIIWMGSSDDPAGDSIFPGIVDAAMAALRTAYPMPVVVADPWTGAQTQIVDIGEVMRGQVIVSALEDEGYLRYDAKVSLPVQEILTG